MYNQASSSFDTFLSILIAVGIILVALVGIGLILARLYRRASKEVSFVRTGLGGQKVIMNGGAIVLPVLHEIIPINMNTLRLEVRRADNQALITRDRMRVDVLAEFYVRAQPTSESIANAAQTLGLRTMNPDALRELVEGKFVDALRAVAAEMTMEELHEQRVAFVQKVQAAVSEDLLKNGLELESVSLTGLDQTNREYFNPDNAFDAAGLTRLTNEIENKRRQRNEIEQDTLVAIEQKNLEAERQRLQIQRETEYARLEQQREVEIRRAAQMAEIAAEQSAKKRDASTAEIEATQQVELARIRTDRETEEQRIERERAVETANIERHKAIELSRQDQAIAIAEKSRALSESEAEADRARALAVKAEEEVVTVREREKAERQRAVELIEARRVAEQEAIKITVAADAEKTAAIDEAEAVRTHANAQAEKLRIEAEGEAEAEKMRAAAAELRYKVEALGRKALNEADNLLSQDIVDMKIRLALIERLRDIVEQSVKPMTNIDGIKIFHVEGLNGGGNGAAAHENGSGNGGLADQIVASALRYRTQAPLVDAILKEVGLSGGLENMPGSLADAFSGKNNGAAHPTDDTTS